MLASLHRALAVPALATTGVPYDSRYGFPSGTLSPALTSNVAPNELVLGVNSSINSSHNLYQRLRSFLQGSHAHGASPDTAHGGHRSAARPSSHGHVFNATTDDHVNVTDAHLDDTNGIRLGCCQ